MKEFEEVVKNFKKEILKKVKKSRIWKEKDILDGKIVNAFVLILRTKGCFWAKESGCSMCGYYRETYDASYDEIKRQVDEAYMQYEGEEIVKIFTSGSFLDEKEVPKELRNYIFKKFSKAKKIIVETRPEFVDELEEISNEIRLEIAMGLESANNKVLEHSINKGFTFEEWKKSAEKVISFGRELKVYILIKPPFLTENDAIKDAVRSAEKVKGIATTISFNPVSIHGKTLVEYLWKKNLYSPPWLWSVVEVLKETRNFYDGYIKCDIVAGGKERGSHNCGKCDKDVLKAIKNFNFTQDIREFDNLKCICQEEWRDLLEIEEFFKG